MMVFRLSIFFDVGVRDHLISQIARTLMFPNVFMQVHVLPRRVPSLPVLGIGLRVPVRRHHSRDMHMPPVLCTLPAVRVLHEGWRAYC